MRKGIKLSAVGIIIACCAFLLTEPATYAKTPFPQFSVVRQKCSVCHKLDKQGRVEVIEETRKTPEEWKVVVERMIRINGAPIEDAEFDPVIKDLGKYLILTPKEMKEVAYINSDENSQYREVPKNKLEERIFTACVRCHTYGKIRSHRKTLAQWKENMHMHLGYQPTVVPQMREMDWPKESMEIAKLLSDELAFNTPEWRAWMKNRKNQDLSGKWRVAGFQPGMGYYEGVYVFKPNPKKGEDEYLVERKVRYRNGTVLRMNGYGTLYGEYHLRYALAPTPLTGRIEGVFDLDADTMGFTGKWWTEVQDTNAYGDERFYKMKGAPRIFSVFPKSLKASGKSRTLTLIGIHLSKGIQAGDITFDDPAVKVDRIVKASRTAIVCKVTAGAGASRGACGINVKGAACGETVTVYKQLDGIKVFPELGRARVSCGAAYPPQGVQFVARGVDYGKDGKADTPDDLILDPVPAKWWLEEEKTRDNDDDLKYLNLKVINGLYTPITTYGPIEERAQRREGVGLIAIRASYSSGGKTFKGKALLGVTDPDFIPHIK